MALPERSPGKQRRRCWFSPSSTTKYVTIRSKVGWFEGHWIGKANRSIRCSGKSCTICASGHSPRVFTYVFVEEQSGEILVWEIPERLFDLAREIEGSVFEGVGVVVAVGREGVYANSAITAVVVDEREAEELDIQTFVATLGLPPQTPTQPNPKKSAAETPDEPVPCNT